MGAMQQQDLPFGSFGPFGDNEVLLASTKDDAVKFRGAKPGPGRAMLCLSANQIRADGSGMDEVVLPEFKRRYDDPANLEGEYLFSGNDGSGAGDAAMIPFLQLFKDAVVFNAPQLQFLARALAPYLGIVPPPSFPNKLVSPDGHLELDVQNADAPNLTLYQDGIARWSALTGWIPKP